MTFAEFFSMGGYAFYVWTAYGVAFAVLLLNWISALRRASAVRKDLQRVFKLERNRP